MLPKMLLLKQNQPCSEEIQDIPAAVRRAVRGLVLEKDIFEGKKVGIAVGSRGISNETKIVKTVIEIVKEKGGQPIIFAAMGCHGEASAEGQREMLSSLGFTEESMGCPVETCADSVEYGKTDSGLTVIGNTLPFTYDAIILVNRIKMHTDFSDITESGLMKLCAIGIGNPAGCNNVHKYALRFGYGEVIRETGLYMIKKLPVVFGIAITENWKHQTDRIVAVKPENILKKEIELLAAVKAQNVRIPLEKADALIVQDIGKNISGTGMDTKVIGRIRIFGQKEPENPNFSRIGVLRLSEASHGNAIGIGLADFAPMGMLEKINIRATAINGWSSMCAEQGSLPCFVDTDRDVFEQCIQTIGLDDPSKARIVFIQDTNTLSRIAVSETLYEAESEDLKEEELKNNPSLEKIGEPFDLRFDEDGRLLTMWKDGKLQF